MEAQMVLNQGVEARLREGEHLGQRKEEEVAGRVKAVEALVDRLEGREKRVQQMVQEVAG